MKTTIKKETVIKKKTIAKKALKNKVFNSYSNAYKDFIKDIEEFNAGNFKPSKRGLVTVNVGGL